MALKKICLLLLIYTAGQLRPVTAMISDVLAHTFFYSKHVTTVHFEKGHYHLHYELKDIQDNNSSESQTGQETQSESSPHVHEVLEEFAALQSDKQTYCFPENVLLHQQFIEKLKMPPRTVA